MLSKLIQEAIKAVQYALVKCGVSVVLKHDWQSTWEERACNVVGGAAGLNADGRGVTEQNLVVSFVAEQLLDLKLLQPGFRWLDVGIGSGELHKTVCDSLRFQTEPSGSDYSLSSLKLCAQKGNGANLIGCIASRLPFRNDSFDFVLLYSVVHYLTGYQELERVIREFARVVKVGRAAFIGDVRVTGLLSYQAFNAQWFIPSTAKIKNVCERAGFTMRVVPRAGNVPPNTRWRQDFLLTKIH